uniref:Cytochrome c oxidase subunit 2 n=1 Tax=Pinctada maxima TaxID=104660 RepID=J9PC55_PINMA|nr:cytochrome c oxidase subunit II [Pinctada maxima]
MSYWGTCWFNDAMNDGGSRLLYVYHLFVQWLLGVGVVVGGGLVSLFLLEPNEIWLLVQREEWLEALWTMVPMAILFMLCCPSYKLLCLLEDLSDPKCTVKVVGNQWYWQYEYDDYESLMLSQYMVSYGSGLGLGGFRNLEVDRPAVLPYHVWIRVAVTSFDVIHSWTLPCLAVKVDGVPGRLNQVPLYIRLPGVYHGQCSEICGANHAFMPIMVEAVSVVMYREWIKKLGGCMPLNLVKGTWFFLGLSKPSGSCPEDPSGVFCILT